MGEMTTRAEVDAIRARDRAVVARIGKPDLDPLLRAEMDRRALLRYLDAAERERDALDRVRALADEWDEVADRWPFAVWHDSQKANARSLRAALDGGEGR